MPGKQKQSSTTSQTTQGYAPALPLVNSQIAGAQNWMNSPEASSYYQGPRVAGMSGQTQQGIDYLTAGNGTQKSADYLSGVVGGDFLSAGNPYQADLDSSIKSSIMPGLNSTFSASGMTGSTMHQGVLAKALTEGLAAPRYQNYQNERAMQQNAAGMLPGVENTRAQQLLTAGQTREGYDQREIEAARQAFEEQRTAGLRPYLDTLPISQLGLSAGQTSSGTQTQTSKPSLGQSIIGAGMMGASLLAAPYTGGASMMPTMGVGASGNSWGMNAPYGSLPWQTA